MVSPKSYEPKMGFDIFRTGGTCPACAARFEVTRCLQCGRASPIRLWAGRTLDPSGWPPS